MNLMVTGCNGQLGNEIKLLSSQHKDFHFLFSDSLLRTPNSELIDELDITDFSKLEKYISEHNVDCIVNCAAYTAVDKAESEPELAAKINVQAVSNLAKLSKQFNLLLIHVSTDYVFDGMNYKPYLETDKTNPTSVYGKTKLLGDKEILSNATKAIIIRTSWLYSSFGNNFVKSIIKNARERGKLNVVYDQIGTPTYARDLAKVILDIISIELNGIHYPASSIQNPASIYNFSNEGVCSWYDFAKAILELSNIECTINPIETKDYPTPAKRPPYSVLSKDKIKDKYGLTIPYWRDSLIDCLNILNAKE